MRVAMTMRTETVSTRRSEYILPGEVAENTSMVPVQLWGMHEPYAQRCLQSRMILSLYKVYDTIIASRWVVNPLPKTKI